MNVGLRIDVDTYRGTRSGVPALVGLLDKHGIEATFFFSVGPDNMGRHLWRLWRPSFLWKLLRSRAIGLYGWDILLRGTLWPGPRIGRGLKDTIRGAATSGHEIGMHAWDHHAWQVRFDSLSAEEIRTVTRKGVESLTAITGASPSCAAAPGWRCSDLVLREQASFPFIYQSDCRGHSVFLPKAGDLVLDRPQIPVTLPTYDELIGHDGTTDETYNQRLLDRLDGAALNVLAIHAEVEGIARYALFEDFLERARAEGVRFVPLSRLLPEPGELPVARLQEARIPGRAGFVACQGPSELAGSTRSAGLAVVQER